MAEGNDDLMLDANAHHRLKEDVDLLRAVIEAGVNLHLSAIQANEIENGLENCSEEVRENILSKIHLVEDLADPIITGVETSAYGELYSYNYGGPTGDIYEELVEPHPNIRNVDRPDAIGAEAAINRDMPFVTGDIGLQDKMVHCGYGEYVPSLSEFIERFEGDRV